MVFLASQVMGHSINQIKQQNFWATIVFGPKFLNGCPKLHLSVGRWAGDKRYIGK
jgi:hypothetical protein